jgi:hypothetical protein
MHIIRRKQRNLKGETQVWQRQIQQRKQVFGRASKPERPESPATVHMLINFRRAYLTLAKQGGVSGSFCFGVDATRSGAYILLMRTRKQSVVLTEPQLQFLKAEAERLGISVSDLIRRIIDQHREKKN